MNAQPMTADWQAMVDALAAIDIDATSMLAVLRHGWDLLATGKSSSHVDFSALHQQLLDGGFDCAVPGCKSKWSVRNVSVETLRRSLSADWVRKVMGDERREFAALRIDFFHRNADVSFHVVPGLAKVLLTQPDLLLANMVDSRGACLLPEAAALDPSIPKPRPPKRPALLGEREYWAENIERESITIDQPASLSLAIEALGRLPHLRVLRVIGIRPAELPVLVEAMARHPRLRAAALEIETQSIVDGQWQIHPVADADASALQAAWSCCQQLTTLSISWFPQAYLAVLLAQASRLRRLGICGQIDVANRRRLLALKSERLIELDLSRADVALDFVRELDPKNLPALQKIGVLVGSGIEVARDWNGADVGTYVGLSSPANIKRRYLADRPWAVGCWISDGWLLPGRPHDD